MAKLILSLDGMVLRDFKIETERVKIGRKPHNDMQIDNLAISGEHAVITTIQGDSFLEDLGSTNGTLVNGQPVKKHFMQDGDLIELGKYKIKYLREGVARPAQEDFEKTMVIRSPLAARPAISPDAPRPAATGDTTTRPTPAFRPEHTTIQEPVDPQPVTTPMGETVQIPPVAPTPAAERIGVIQVLTGGNAGKTLDLVKNLTSLGKPGVQVAIITKRPNGYFITHVEGPNRPMVNGAQIGVQATELKEHDIIELAGIKMEFFYK